MWNRRGAMPPLDYPVRVNRDSPQAAGLVDWWTPLGIGRSVRLPGNIAGIPGIPTNGPTWRPDPVFGAAYQFVRASSQYISMGTDARLHLSSAFCIAAWIRSDSWGVEFRTIASHRTANAAGAYGVNVSLSGFVQVFLHDGSGFATLLDDTTALATGTRYHVLSQYSDALNTFEIYINGRLVKSSASVTAVLSSANHEFCVGRIALSAEHFDGIIGDVRLYNRFLTPAEVWQLYDPATRWELYAPTPRLWVVPEAAAAGGVPKHFMFYQRGRQ